MSLEGSVLTEREALSKIDYVHDTVVIYKAAIHKTTQNKKHHNRRPANPPDLRFVRKQTRHSNKQTKRGRSPTKTPTTEVEMLPSQWEKTHCEKSN